MKIKQFLKWQVLDSRMSIGIFTGTMLIIYTLSFLLFRIFSINGNISGSEISYVIYSFVFNIVLFRESLRFALANGISRRTMFLSSLLMTGLTAIFMTVLSLAIKYGFGYLTNTSSLFEQVFGTTSLSGTFLAEILWLFIVTFSAGIIGLFISAAYYRMNKGVTLLVSIGIPAFFFVVLPIAISVMSETVRNRLLQALSAVFIFMVETPYQSMLVMIGVILVFSLFSFFLIRRAPLKL